MGRVNIESTMNKAGSTHQSIRTYPADWLKTWVEQQVSGSEGQGVNIIVIDTPAYLDHPCFPAEKIKAAWEFITHPQGLQISPRPVQADGTPALTLNEKFSAHGTAIVGLLCARNEEIPVPLHFLCEQSTFPGAGLLNEPVTITQNSKNIVPQKSIEDTYEN